MKKVCGTCNFGIDHKARNSFIEVFCAFDSIWYIDNKGCIKWNEFIGGL
ncbi:MAG: hypothetical protein HQK79_15265 [Desulfobacterales bacterium]|nr:hypothetical protein [Desulfobacterales bacterium]